jgi:hypothetical protein
MGGTRGSNFRRTEGDIRPKGKFFNFEKHKKQLKKAKN